MRITYFNPRLREGGDENRGKWPRKKSWFQSTPPRRRRLAKILKPGLYHIFQSTPPRRRRQEVDGYTTYSADFNPRLREGGDEKDSVKVGESFEFQSTPPRRRRPSKCKHRLTVFFISIHASAKEATFPLYLLWMGKRFQSTPPRRRRRKPVRCRKPMHCHFNPRLREGGDVLTGTARQI